MKHGGNVNPLIIRKADGVPAHHQNFHTMDGVTDRQRRGAIDGLPMPHLHQHKEITGAVQRASAANVNP